MSKPAPFRFLLLSILALAAACGGGGGSSGGGGGSGSGGTATTTNPILFVTQVPTPDIFRTITSTFATHEGRNKSAPRGGDLWIRYPDGTLRNLTEEAGYGVDGMQVGPNAIAVRDPCVHWNGTKAVFSMVVGGPALNDTTEYFWQLYEVTGLAKGQTATITKISNQPTGYNNVSPCYGSDNRILFTSDRPRNGAAHLYPQLDEYEEKPTNTGLWSLQPGSGDLFLVQHSPSGSFKPFVDSFGRVVFGRWDHMERDQQKDLENISAYRGGAEDYGTFNYSDESAFAVNTGNNEEVFPEPRSPWVFFIENPSSVSYMGDLNGYEPGMVGNDFNLFFPWTVNQDGTSEETLNHIGRHELRGFVDRSIRTDPNVVGQGVAPAQVANRNSIQNIMQLREDPTNPGTYYAVDCKEFFQHAAGQIVKITGDPSLDANQMVLTYVTPRETQGPANVSTPDHSGFYRNPTPLSDGGVLVSHADHPFGDDPGNPQIVHDFRIRLLEQDGSYWKAGDSLTKGIVKSVTNFEPLKQEVWPYTGPLWELDPVEVVAKPFPPMPTGSLGAPEAAVLADEGVSLNDLRSWLASKDLALVISRNVTTRDKNDKQQPYNLRVPGGAQTMGAGGTVYDIEYLRFFQGDQIRGIGLTPTATQPLPGRRVLAQELHDANALAYNPASTGGASSVELGLDGSMAALVPARRAMSWQLESPSEEAVVRERFWVTFQPGEVRTCASCHGINEVAQDGSAPPQNEPEALRALLQHLKGLGQL